MNSSSPRAPRSSGGRGPHLRLEPGSSLGPVQNEPQYRRLLDTLDEVERRGAKVLPVTILDNPPDDAGFVTQENFGLIRSIFRYRVVDDAIRTDTRQGGWVASAARLGRLRGRSQEGATYLLV